MSVSKQDDIDATRKQVGEDAEIIGGGAENGHFTYVTGRKLNREERRQSKKHDERYVVSRIHIEFENGQAVDLDVNKVMLIDKDTKAQLFDYVIES